MHNSKLNHFLCYCLMLSFSACDSKNKVELPPQIYPPVIASANVKKAHFASGCFWCVESIFQSVLGVHEVIPGYSGGPAKYAKYDMVSSGETNHVESVEVYYDSLIIDFPTLVNVFFGSHDATTANRQGPDFGPQYRSVIFYHNPIELYIADSIIQKINLDGGLPQGTITTQLISFKAFYPAEEEHQDYEAKHPDNTYILEISKPRFNKFKSKFGYLLKENQKGH